MIWRHVAVTFVVRKNLSVLSSAGGQIHPSTPNDPPAWCLSTPPIGRGNWGTSSSHTGENPKGESVFDVSCLIAFFCSPPDTSYHLLLCRVFKDHQAAVVSPAELGALVPTEILPKPHREEVAALPPPAPTGWAPTAPGVCSTGVNF